MKILNDRKYKQNFIRATQLPFTDGNFTTPVPAKKKHEPKIAWAGPAICSSLIPSVRLPQAASW